MNSHFKACAKAIVFLLLVGPICISSRAKAAIISFNSSSAQTNLFPPTIKVQNKSYVHSVSDTSATHCYSIKKQKGSTNLSLDSHYTLVKYDTVTHRLFFHYTAIDNNHGITNKYAYYYDVLTHTLSSDNTTQNIAGNIPNNAASNFMKALVKDDKFRELLNTLEQ